jgi:hypothetical protein
MLVLGLCGCAQTADYHDVVQTVSDRLELTKSAGFLRSTIETYPEAERRPILDYLDKARVAADATVKSLSVGFEEFIRGIHETTKGTGQQVDFSETSEQIREKYGLVTSSEYRGQAIETLGDVHDLAKASAATFYAIRTTKRPNEGLYLTVKTMRFNGEHRVFYAQFLEYVGNVPPWLLPSQRAL